MLTGIASPARFLEIQGVHGRSGFHGACLDKTVQEQRTLPGAAGETSYLCTVLFRLPITVGYVGHERPRPLVFVAPGASLFWPCDGLICRERERERADACADRLGGGWADVVCRTRQ